MANMTHVIKLGNIVAEIVAPTPNGYHIRAYGSDFRAIIKPGARATVVGRNICTGRMESTEVRV